MAVANVNNTNFFANANRQRVAMIPGAMMLTQFANKRQGTGGAASYNSRVLASQQNGAGPAISPTAAPWSFQDFATGIRTTIRTGMKRRISQ